MVVQEAIADAELRVLDALSCFRLVLRIPVSCGGGSSAQIHIERQPLRHTVIQPNHAVVQLPIILWEYLDGRFRVPDPDLPED